MPRRVRLVVRTQPSQGWCTGSTPVRAASLARGADCAENSRRYTVDLMPYKDIVPPAGDKITRDQTLNVPERPVIPFIRGDGTGPDIWAASERVFDAAVQKAYGGKKH